MDYEPRQCKFCGQQFKPDRTTQQYCTEACQRKGYQRPRLYTYICKFCGIEYKAKEKNRNQYCCRDHAYADIQAWRRQPEVIDKVCLSCGQPFESTNSKVDYCSDECRLRGSKCTCQVCGTVFYARAHRCYCSEKCEREYKRTCFIKHKIAIGRNGGRVETLTCLECGKDFRRRIWNRTPSFCSRKCAHINWEKANPDKARTMEAKQRHARRARKYGNGSVDNIDPMMVYERDGWKCGICGKDVLPDCAYPHPMSASLDHIIPLSRGGTHTWENVQLAHFQCNSEKRDKGSGQLRLRL